MIETRGFKIFRFFGLAFLSLVVIVPLYVVLTTSIKPLADVQGLFTWIPSRVTLEPYVQIWQTVPLASYFKNSLIVTISATILSVAMAVLAAYALARLRFKGQRSFSLVVLSTQMFPGILFLLPLFLIFVQIQRTVGVQLTGSYLGLIITYMTFSLPFSIWMLTGYFASIPKELEEASMIDGTGRLGALFRVIIPVAKPGIIAVAVYAFITAWGEVLFASVLTSKDTRTLSIGLRAYASQQDVYWNQLMAASVVVSLPVLIGFMLVQKHLITGLSSGAVK
ncbi:carbohydrate ABC transporter permease [Frigoribacterium sp. ACAM 257]|jgi:multiple sugar transport system permease protein|uniref:carbohydrate ABC transporter permease n=1 Tax=unclassified Frigoribacterium TaxID=2627005 RepID=UPI0011BA3CA4|nr:MULTISPECIES: carbohydrate ABC transporter permease [unclassified Frigoribacterium]MBD8585070.1 carbohydrate ABC transporter permease [Frigoribacterium sp. CFBP 8766]MBD8609835.1 carbohydrate ABC transporter permease [Frigoribacterium sp. CFBP 13729]MBP1190104.1 multiple sugar transport system permease protein [Frigoribacterium sp. PvP032]TWX40150.1 carbohydrate ABC transporter permease [Frigoribacterium sp. ACAM 257]